MTLTDLSVTGIEAKTYSRTAFPTPVPTPSPSQTPTPSPTNRPEVALFHTIKVKVKNLPEWLNQKCGAASDFILFIDGNALKDMTPSLVNGDELQFDLRRNSDSQENMRAWMSVLSRRPKDWSHYGVSVTVGLANGSQLTSSQTANLTVINFPWFVVFVISFAAAIGIFVWLARVSDIIRDAGPQPEGLDKRGRPNRKTYSLARTQMAFWFFIIASSYVFIWMVTSALTGPTAGVLGLMGISAATGLGAAVIDSSRRGNQDSDREGLEQTKKDDEVAVEKLKSEIAALSAAINTKPAPADLEAQKATLVTKEAELAAKQMEIDQLTQSIQARSNAAKSTPSKSFLKDILSDDGGVSFHRFQIVVWTLVLIFIFIAKVVNDLSMPEFDGTLLALMGISGGTYIGFKLPNQEG